MTEAKKVLIVEDDKDMVEAMKVILSAYQVSTAYTPEDGMAIAKAEKPDVIILDVMFGGTGKSQGFDYAVKMKQDKSIAAIPILMATAVNIDSKDYKFSPNTDGEYLPVDEFVEKRVQPAKLVRKVEALIKKGTSDWINWPDKK